MCPIIRADLRGDARRGIAKANLHLQNPRYARASESRHMLIPAGQREIVNAPGDALSSCWDMFVLAIYKSPALTKGTYLSMRDAHTQFNSVRFTAKWFHNKRKYTTSVILAENFQFRLRHISGNLSDMKRKLHPQRSVTPQDQDDVYRPAPRKNPTRCRIARDCKGYPRAAEAEQPSVSHLPVTQITD